MNSNFRVEEEGNSINNTSQFENKRLTRMQTR
jgi:hypothetical protein